MSHRDYEYNDIDENTFKIKKLYKEKGKKYGFFSIEKPEINVLMSALELMSSSPSISPKFSKKLESYLIPRFNEIFGIITTNKTLPEQLKIEMSKENQKDVLDGLSLPIIIAELKAKKIVLEKLNKNLKEMKMSKSES